MSGLLAIAAFLVAAIAPFTDTYSQDAALISVAVFVSGSYIVRKLDDIYQGLLDQPSGRWRQ